MVLENHCLARLASAHIVDLQVIEGAHSSSYPQRGLGLHH